MFRILGAMIVVADLATCIVARAEKMVIKSMKMVYDLWRCISLSILCGFGSSPCGSRGIIHLQKNQALKKGRGKFSLDCSTLYYYESSPPQKDDNMNNTPF